MDKKIDRLKNHFIVCGYGRIGRVLCRNLQRTPHDLVVVENDSELIPVMDEDGVLYVAGDATDEAPGDVIYTHGDGTEETIYKDDTVECSDSTNEGWQYAPNDNSKILLCGEACEKVKADSQASISIQLGCVTQVVPK